MNKNENILELDVREDLRLKKRTVRQNHGSREAIRGGASFYSTCSI